MNAAPATMGAVILAGGGARRLDGIDKGRLRLDGRCFLDRLLFQLRDFSEIVLAVDRADRYPDFPGRVLVDAVPGRGPMQGLAQALETCASDALLAVAVDMPLFERGLAEYLAAFFHPGCKAVAAMDRRGRRQPLCALYAKAAAPVLFEQLARDRGSLREALDLLAARDAPLVHSIYPDSLLANINTPADLAALRAGAAAPPVLAVCGEKNSGKTTLLRGVIPLLRQAGLRVGVVKHDGHDFMPDVPGTDSHALRLAGAERVAVYSAHLGMLAWEGGAGAPEDLLPHFAGLDLVLVEGGKHTGLPKIEVVRGGGGSVCCRDGLLAICADAPVAAEGVAVLDVNDHGSVCDFVLDRVGSM